ncbi:MAG: pyrroline-5-carboxylate reductase dimerization domain-containing protein [Erythrobacter sp.]|uniref:pyrroline-5-carboxylate reductase family protein n=1 Tax=Erythrobacter sp. TaxID=1042 RepID=UPI0032983925
MTQIKKLLIIGCGNMAGAMLAGWLAAGFEPMRFSILSKSLEAAPGGVPLYRDVSEAVAAGGHDAVMLGFKPQQLGQRSPEIQALTGEGIAVYSLLAGITLKQLKAAYPSASSHIRVMPNLACRVNKSPIILAETGMGESDRTHAFAFFNPLGTALWLEEEAKYDLVTALAGSGPGFVYRFIDALAEAAVELGLERDQATSLALATVDGASTLAANADASPSVLADQVASPGGMTREGLNVLDSDKALVELLIRTLEGTANRGAELSAGAN